MNCQNLRAVRYISEACSCPSTMGCPGNIWRYKKFRPEFTGLKSSSSFSFIAKYSKMFDIKTFIEAEKGESPCLFQNKRQLNLTLSKKFPTLGILSHKNLKYALNIVYRQEL